MRMAVAGRMSGLLCALALAQAGCALISSGPNPALERSLSENVALNGSGHAVNGYDPVALLEEGRRIEGSERYNLEYKDATYLFASPENRQAFARRPEQYIPVFNGFCAWGVGDPNGPHLSLSHVFTVHGGRLYGFYNEQVLTWWQENPARYIALGKEAWPRLQKDPKTWADVREQVLEARRAYRP